MKRGFVLANLPSREDRDLGGQEHLLRSTNRFQKFRMECGRASTAGWTLVRPLVLSAYKQSWKWMKSRESPLIFSRCFVLFVLQFDDLLIPHHIKLFLNESLLKTQNSIQSSQRTLTWGSSHIPPLFFLPRVPDCDVSVPVLFALLASDFFFSWLRSRCRDDFLSRFARSSRCRRPERLSLWVRSFSLWLSHFWDFGLA